VAYHYIGGMRDQQFLLPTSMRDWLAEGHLAWFVIEVVERIDTTRLHLRHLKRWARPPGVRPRHDAHAAAVRVRDRAPSLSGWGETPGSLQMLARARGDAD
jgi:hypothetical protein